MAYDMLETHFEAVKQELSTFKKVIPKIFTMFNEGDKTRPAIMALMFRNNEEKKGMRKAVKKFLKVHNVKEYYFISEMWMTQSQPDKLMVRAAQDRERKEGIMVMGYNLDISGSKVVSQMFTRDDKGDIVFQGEKIYVDIPGERSTGFDYWDVRHTDEEVDEVCKKNIAEHDQKVIETWSKELAKKWVPKLHMWKELDEQGRENLTKDLFSDIELYHQNHIQRILEDPDKDDDL